MRCVAWSILLGLDTANSCFASSVLQCLLNQSIFKDALGGVSKFPCKDCHKANGCAVAVAADLSREYVYGKESVLPSINVIKSLQSKVIALPCPETAN